MLRPMGLHALVTGRQRRRAWEVSCDAIGAMGFGGAGDMSGWGLS